MIEYNDKGINLGFGHIIPRSNIALVLSLEKKDVRVQRVVEEAKASGRFLDLSRRSSARSVVLTFDGKVLKTIRRSVWVQSRLTENAPERVEVVT